MQELTREEIHKFNSQYVTSILLTESINIDKLFVSEGYAKAELSIVSDYMDKTGLYHLTVPLVVSALFQVALVATAKLEGLTDGRENEAFMRELQVKCSKPVRKKTGISFHLKQIRRSSSSFGRYFIGEFSVEDRSFFGKGSIVF